jgi:hypothetical protein
MPACIKIIFSKTTAMYKTVKKRLFLLIAATLLLLPGCKTLITTYDAYSYTQLASLKVEVIALMNKATEDYSTHAANVEKLTMHIQKAYEYDTHKPKNAVMTKMWQYLYDALLSNEMEGIAGRQYKKGFFKNWEAAKKKSAIFVEEATTKIVSPMFSLLMELESKKLKQSTAESMFEKIKQGLGVAQ